MKKHIALVSALILAVTAMVSCGNNDSSSESKVSSQTAAEETTAPGTSAPETAPEEEQPTEDESADGECVLLVTTGHECRFSAPEDKWSKDMAKSVEYIINHKTEPLSADITSYSADSAAEVEEHLHDVYESRLDDTERYSNVTEVEELPINAMQVFTLSYRLNDRTWKEYHMVCNGGTVQFLFSTPDEDISQYEPVIMELLGTVSCT